MSLPQQFKTARISNATRADLIDDAIGALEIALTDILGIPIDTDITRAIFGVTADGILTVLQSGMKVNGPLGLLDGTNRFRYLNSMARASRTSDQVISDSVLTAVSFDSEIIDTDNIFTLSSATRLTATIDGGVYLVIGHVSFANNPTGWRNVRLNINGSPAGFEITQNAVVGADTGMPPVVFPLRLNAGDYVELIARQTSGGDLAVQAGSFLAMHYSGE